MFCPTYMQQLCELKKEKKRLHNKKKKNPLLVLQWIAKASSCGSELVFLDLYPESPAAKQKQTEREKSFLLPSDTSRGRCAQVRRMEEDVSVCGSCAG